MDKKRDDILEELSLVINHDEPVAVSQTPDEDQDDQKNLLKELVKLIKVSAIKVKCPPVQAKDHGLVVSYVLCLVLPCGATYVSMERT